MNESSYTRTTFLQRQERGQWSSSQLRAYQLSRLNHLFERILPANLFYREKFRAALNQDDSLELSDLSELNHLPMTTKQELVDSDGDTGFAANLTFSPDQYTRFHRTSGTRGRPMIVLDTQDDWNWWMEVWQYVLDSASLVATDRVLMAFSFGPFIGFWSAFDAAVERGAMVVPTGAMTSIARLQLIQSLDATLVFCTPSYALHLAEVAEQIKLDLRSTRVSRIVVAGEPGGSIPAIRDRIESAWGAKVIDHSGASEVGPWGFADIEQRGVHVNEAEFIPEFLPIGEETSAAILDAEAIQSQPDDQLYELILTCLGRIGSPVIRYRTGDLVRPTWIKPTDDSKKSRFAMLRGGVLGRTDDMMIIRGVNVFPTSIEQILREFPEIDEYRIVAYKTGELDQLKVDVEHRLNDSHRIEEALQNGLGFRVEVNSVASNSLPRFEAKGQRFIDQRE